MRFPYAHLHEAGHGTKKRYRIAAAADPVKQRTEAVRDFAPEEERDSVRLFKDAASLLAEPRLADVAIIGTQDDYHYAPCRKAMELGYHVLLEKPIAKTLKEALELRDTARLLKRRVAVCHVLRYTQFYRTLKKSSTAGKSGKSSPSMPMKAWGRGTLPTPSCADTGATAKPPLP